MGKHRIDNTAIIQSFISNGDTTCLIVSILGAVEV